MERFVNDGVILLSLGVDAPPEVPQGEIPVSFADKDIFINAVGGLALREPAVDLAIGAALLSALLDRPLPSRTVFFGEIGLLGEVRSVSRVEARLAEAAHLGYESAWMALPERAIRQTDLQIQAVGNLADLMVLTSGGTND